MVDLEKERKAFEEDLAEHLTERNSDGFYISGDLQLFWEKHVLKAEINALKAENSALKEKLEKVEGGEYVVVKKDDIENWYLDEGEYVWYEKDSIDGYLEDIDNGEVLEVQRKEYVVINSNPVFATNVFTDSDNIQWELFDSKEDAEKAATHCKAMIEAAQGDGDE